MITNNKKHLFFDDVYFFNSPEISNFVEPSMQFINNKSIYTPELRGPVEKIGDKQLTETIKYSLNNYGQRSSDYYKLLDTDFNILFAGCSITFGEFLPEGYAWPHHVYNYYKEEYSNLGPYRSISFLGGSATEIILNVFKYIDLYGRPNVICILLPDMFRYYEPKLDGSSFQHTVEYIPKHGVSDSLMPFRGMQEFVQSYRALHIMCKISGIKLLATSWDDLANEKIKDIGFDTYGIINNESQDSFIKSLDLDELGQYDERFFYSASDNIHPGLLRQMFFAKHFIDRIANEKEN